MENFIVRPILNVRSESPAHHSRTADFPHCAPQYRPDIDGLRAIAVSAVLAFHAFPASVPGGFIGVDVFFVISGYLITGIIARDLRQGTFGLLDFYRRRIRRIVPALVLVLAASCATAWFVLTPGELAMFGKSAAWSAVFLGNGFLAVSGGYFETSTYLNPLLHLWSLGVEEQFYLLWPVLLLRSEKQDATRQVLLAVVIASFAIGIWGAMESPATHFYHLSCRAWELGAGGWLAVSRRSDIDGRAQRIQSGSGAGVVASAGVALIVGSAVWLNPDRAFPGWWSVIPITGAVLTIAAGSANWISRCVLGSKPLRFVGRISYSLYLWHWPVLAYCRIIAGRPLSAELAAGSLAAAFAAACATYFLVENPIRSGSLGRRAAPALLTALGTVALAGTAFAGRWLPARLTGPAVVRVDRARIDWEFPVGSNPTMPFRTRVLLPSHRPQTVLFVGDSHMQQYWPRINYVIEANPHSARSAEFATYSGCPPLPGVNTPAPGSFCSQFFDHAMHTALRGDIDTVVFGAFWEAYFLGEFSADRARHPLYSVTDPLRTPLELNSYGTQRALEEFRVVLSRLVASGRRVFIVLSNPTSPLFDPTSMLPAETRLGRGNSATMALDPGRRSIDANPFEVFVAPLHRRLREIAVQSGAKILDPSDTLCDELRCASVADDGTPLYKDTNHVRPFFARARATFIDEALLAPAREP